MANNPQYDEFMKYLGYRLAWMLGACMTVAGVVGVIVDNQDEYYPWWHRIVAGLIAVVAAVATRHFWRKEMDADG